MHFDVRKEDLGGGQPLGGAGYDFARKYAKIFRRSSKGQYFLKGVEHIYTADGLRLRAHGVPEHSIFGALFRSGGQGFLTRLGD